MKGGGGEGFVIRRRRLGLSSLCEVAAGLSRFLTGDMSVSVSGDLGVGKTEFCRCIVCALSSSSFLGSPTFSIVHEYECCGFLLYHVDLYRISSVKEAQEVGLFDILSGNLVLVEWPEVLGSCVKFDIKLSITNSKEGGDMRDLVIVSKIGKLPI
ncbi:tRNA (adenosine(37)-N6)-threonylcarbamoyltransferase complex ATPase subunit type 1 TsaE [Anaplasma capra]|uniref:tRNA (adenosine(37)-N6)-threonylcarbamoyltransferase complex ATPase subunit type 1 TsaE n=1 Tax=Anaplasma capra TaxID=1562740 RepID=UPI0021D5BFC3|nr:tRNA (adenosine(37)-N6)-threonylcarbamoyltransferase complex ATPase subunit type 1 TsaE [Anaplasma capra]MCU7611172.1 tRNA (adenosine(37)-N6)-threonylcarbamoyltransferase complex ATPase subunit type 1 TsaE [Anaplasma capra]MCU7612324.1 tRNA (adenosine(37)-N6)-threonylcarbamoyltransferase complex ATPase subunit type 1 TsaE [Anaplasma capra]